ncbi:MAG: hypothetical protein LBQ34_01295 [Alphaproteobacteria bacterium]|jgi:lipopolysaccharide biosynthesis glycosyltransferase|nr:hypothetical protein [Alphaproteobacteria bacterium]
MNQYSITITTNRAHLLFSFVTIYSLLKHNQDYDINIYLLHNNCLDMAEIDDICNKFPMNQFSNFKIHLVDVASVAIINNLPQQKYWTKEIYYKLFLQDLLPNVDRILHLDTDVIVVGNIKDFFNTDMEGIYFIGGEDYDDTLCVGVMLINLTELRKINILEEFKKAAIEDNQITEQGFVNKVYRDKVRFTTENYIFTVGLLGYKEEFKRDSTTKIIHLTNPKPFVLTRFKVSDLTPKCTLEYFPYLEDFIEPKSKWKYNLAKYYMLYGGGRIFNSLHRRFKREWRKKVQKRQDFFFKAEWWTNQIYKYAIIKKS